MMDADIPRDEISAFVAEATAGDFDHVLRTCRAWLDLTEEAALNASDPVE
jgi:hypothetical protein